jgi:hypothetical protein
MEAALNEKRQITRMIEMSVRQHDSAYSRRINGQPFPISEAKLFQPLEEAAIDETTLSRRLE